MKIATMFYRYRAGPLAVCLTFLASGLTSAQAATRRVVLPSGTVIPARLDNSLSSKTAHTGDRITATVRYGNDDAGLPQGSRIEGVLSEVVRSANGKAGVLDMDFRSMVTPGGQRQSLSGYLISLDGKNVSRSSSGRLVASGDKSKDRLKWIGIGAGAGLLASVLTKSNTLTDTLLGAGAGYLFNEFGNKPKPGDVNLKSGAEFGIRLDRELTFNTNRPDDNYTPSDTPTNSRNYDRDGTRTTDAPYRGNGSNNSSRDIRMQIDDRNVDFGSSLPYMRNGVSFIPLDRVSKDANFDYNYNAQHKMIEARNGTVRMAIGSRNANVNGKNRRLNAAPEIRNGVVYVPVQFINLASGGSTDWNADNRTVMMTTNYSR